MHGVLVNPFVSYVTVPQSNDKMVGFTLIVLDLRSVAVLSLKDVLVYSRKVSPSFPDLLRPGTGSPVLTDLPSHRRKGYPLVSCCDQ